MATIKEDYCSKEIYRLLIKKGFDGEIHTTFNDEGYTQPSITLQMAMKWLREVNGLHISLEPCYDYDSMRVVFLAFVQNVADVHEFFDGRKNIASYPNAEKSCELAIKYCIENLI